MYPFDYNAFFLGGFIVCFIVSAISLCHTSAHKKKIEELENNLRNLKLSMKSTISSELIDYKVIQNHLTNLGYKLLLNEMKKKNEVPDEVFMRNCVRNDATYMIGKLEEYMLEEKA